VVRRGKAATNAGYGHEFTPENTSYRKDSSPGARRCLACDRRRCREYYNRRGAALRAHRKKLRKESNNDT
jgi:hypothetical protein